MKKEDIHTIALAQFEDAREQEREDRWLAEEDFEFVSGEEQWPETIREDRESQGKPCLQFNRLPVFIRHVMGDARRNRPAVKVSPVDDNADVETAELLSGIVRHIEADSDADISYLSALQTCCEGGIGHWRVSTDYVDEMSFDQEIKIERIDSPFAVYWDTNTRQPNNTDGEWCFVTDWMTLEAFDKQFPNDDEAGVSDWPQDNIVTRYGGWYDASSNKIRVAEYWCKKYEETTIYQLLDGSTTEEKEEGMPYLKKRKTTKTAIYRYLLSGDRILEDAQLWAGKYIPIVSIYGPEEFVDGRIRHVSMIRHAKDPQRMYNFWQSSIAEKIGLAPVVPFIGTVQMFKGLENEWQSANKVKKAYLPYNPDPKAPGGKPERSQPAYINAAEIQQSAQAVEDLKATIGMFDASLGAAGNETSGRAILARQSEGDRATFAWMDNLARGIEHTGRILVDLIPKIYDTQRVARILGEDGSEEMVTLNKMQVTDPLTGKYSILNDLTVGKYDVRVSVGPSYQTRRQEAADSMMAFVQAFPGSAQVVGDLIAKNMDWPGSDDIAERLKALVPPQALKEELTPEEEQAQQAAMQEAQQVKDLEQANLLADTQGKAAKAEKDRADAKAQEVETMLTVTGVADVLGRLSG